MKEALDNQRHSRRAILASACSGLVIGLAGCLEDRAVEEDQATPTPTPGEHDFTPGATSTPSPTPGEGEHVYELGDSVTFTHGDRQLAYSITDAEITNYLFYDQTRSVGTTVPNHEVFLKIHVGMENTGDEEIDTPWRNELLLEGTQYDREWLSQGIDNPYQEFDVLRPGASTEATLLYTIPDSDGTAVLFAEWGYLDSITTQWHIKLNDVDRTLYDFTGNQLGEAIEIHGDSLGYSLTLKDVEYSKSYEWEGQGGYEWVEEARDGHQWALVSITAQNTGEGTVALPYYWDMSLVAEGQQFDAQFYYGDANRYEGGEVAAGVTRDGIVKFEVPEGLESFELMVDLTWEVYATWDF